MADSTVLFKINFNFEAEIEETGSRGNVNVQFDVEKEAWPAYTMTSSLSIDLV